MRGFVVSIKRTRKKSLKELVLKYQSLLLNISRENVRHFWLILYMNDTWTPCIIQNLIQRSQGKVRNNNNKKKTYLTNIWKFRVTIVNIVNSKFIGKLEFVVPHKRDTKKTPLCMYSNKFYLKDGLQDNNWLGHSVMKPVVSVAFKKS